MKQTSDLLQFFDLIQTNWTVGCSKMCCPSILASTYSGSWVCHRLDSTEASYLDEEFMTQILESQFQFPYIKAIGDDKANILGPI